MRKITGKFIVKETNIDSIDQSVVLYGSSDNPNECSNGERVMFYDVCLRDDINGDLLLINSATSHCMLFRSGVGFIPPSSGVYNDRNTR